MICPHLRRRKWLMHKSVPLMVCSGMFCLLIHTSSAYAQPQARAEITNATGTSIGSATFRASKEGVVITVHVKELPPGLHAVHLHAVGTCDGPAFTSAGPHVNPMNKHHGLKNPDGPHAGDLPDMYVQRNGVGRYEVLADSVTLDAAATSLFDADGTALIIHATADDNRTDPAGNAGERIACGVITKAAAKKK
jgi:Cu-Zn family superoxide dismutase